MYIYVIRHGQTDWNKNKKLLSRTDLSLNDEGRKQCENAEEIVKNLDYDLVISSPKKRAMETADIINTKDKEVIIDNNIIERDAGDLEGINVEDFDYQGYWNIKRDGEFGTAETIESCKDRIYKTLDKLKAEFNDKNILIVTHNGICRIIHTYFNGFPRKGNIYDYGVNNAEIKIYEIK